MQSNEIFILLKSPEDLTHLALWRCSSCQAWGLFFFPFTLVSVFVYVSLWGMNYELTLGGSVTHRKHQHLWPAHVSTLPFLFNIHKQVQQIAISLLCCIATQTWAKAGDEWDPSICFSLMLQFHCCSAIPACHSEWVTCQLLLAHFSGMAAMLPAFIHWFSGSPGVWFSLLHC